MNTRSTTIALCIATALVFPSLAQAEGFYTTAQFGYSQQANDVTPYGNNIATDSDFPGEFDASDSPVGGIGFGYAFNEQYRIESRLSYRDASFNDTQFGTGARDGEEYTVNGNLESTTLTIEAFYDFANSTPFTPYIKAGVGVAFNSFSTRLGGAGVAAFDTFDGAEDGYYDAYSDDNSTELSWNIGVGANFAVSKTVSVYGEYQYASFGDVNTGQDAFTDGFNIDNASAHEVMLGLRVAL
ncbi:outer membrane protein [Shewanella frigidimarina]|uniref:Outer membrane protein beta-barrel domain-containing protein n=1 Tax=Shewanella frigidimarina TaxID=56812 RepID=A0A106BZ21_SHEFR|nr:outer membrane beta-barrel protein [Shewanella frigidimarina]KVX01183.1 hypothetical protein AWJ07_06950 [Shewanella frigidimarina]